MQQVLDDIFHETELPMAVIFVRLLGAILLGAMIGYEREYRNRPAGLRTHILVSLAAAVFAIISIEMVYMRHFDEAQVRIDPLRVVEAVTAGVAFLSAGMIFFTKGKVRNLTTGAGMWLAGGVGLAVGLGYWAIGCFSAVACLVVLNILGRLEVKAIGGESDRDEEDVANTGDTQPEALTRV